MTFDRFFQKYNNQYVNWDGKYGFQCKDLFSAYNSEVVFNPNYVWGDAWQLYNSAPDKYYDKILNTPSFVPQKGDACIWKKEYGGFGHVALCLDGCTTTKLIVLGQNYPKVTKLDGNGNVLKNGSPCNVQTMSYNKVMGFLRPKKAESEMLPKEVTQNELFRSDNGAIFWHLPNTDVANKYVRDWSDTRPIQEIIPLLGNLEAQVNDLTIQRDNAVSAKNKALQSIVGLNTTIEDTRKEMSNKEITIEQCNKTIAEKSEEIEKLKNSQVTVEKIVIESVIWNGVKRLINRWTQKKNNGNIKK